jgi:hypothetical protein
LRGDLQIQEGLFGLLPGSQSQFGVRSPSDGPAKNQLAGMVGNTSKNGG